MILQRERHKVFSFFVRIHNLCIEKSWVDLSTVNNKRKKEYLLCLYLFPFFPSWIGKFSLEATHGEVDVFFVKNFHSLRQLDPHFRCSPFLLGFCISLHFFFENKFRLPRVKRKDKADSQMEKLWRVYTEENSNKIILLR